MLGTNTLILKRNYHIISYWMLFKFTFKISFNINFCYICCKSHACWGVCGDPLGFNWLFDHLKTLTNHNGQMGRPLQWLTAPQEGSRHQGISVASCSSSAYWKSLMTTVQFWFYVSVSCITCLTERRHHLHHWEASCGDLDWEAEQ